MIWNRGLPRPLTAFGAFQFTTTKGDTMKNELKAKMTAAEVENVRVAFSIPRRVAEAICTARCEPKPSTAIAQVAREYARKHPTRKDA